MSRRRMHRKKSRVCLIDFDDTLVDYQQEEQGAVKAVAGFLEGLWGEQAGIKFPAAYRQAKRKIMNVYKDSSIDDGTRWDRAARMQETLRFLGREGSSSLIDTMVTVYWEHRLLHVKPYPRAQELLETLGSHCTLILCTEGDTHYQSERLRRSGLATFFDDILISGKIGVTKRDLPRFLGPYYNTDRLRLMISDSYATDIMAASQLGIPTLWLDHGVEFPEHCIASFRAYNFDEVIQHSSSCLLASQAFPRARGP
jgi:2-haloacid dehalogenase